MAKVNQTGTALVYATYLGGSGDDFGFGIAMDAADAVYVVGTTSSPDFPTRSALQGTFGGGSDAFIAKINAAGSSLNFATYLGGGGDDRGIGIAVDGSGKASVTGLTGSPDFPLQDPLQDTFGGSTGDAFVAQLAADGATLDFSTYFGGSGFDFGTAIAVAGSGTIYVSGVTNSPDLPADLASIGPPTGFSTLSALLGDSQPIGPQGEDDVFTLIIGALEAEGEADLAVDKDGPSRATVSSIVVYTVTVTNKGRAVAKKVGLSDIFIRGFFSAQGFLEILSVKPSRGECKIDEEAEPSGLICNLGDLEKDGSIVATIRVRFLAEGVFKNRAHTFLDTFDPNLFNNVARVTTKVGRERRAGARP